MAANYPTSNPDNTATGVGTTDATTATPNTHAGFHDQVALEVVAIGTDLVTAADGLGSIAAKTDAMDISIAAKLVKASNLSDLVDAATARTNLGLGTLATQSGTFSGTSSGTNTGDQTTVSGNAGTVTNGVYTTDTGTVTNTMLAGSIASSKLSNTAVANLSGTNTGDQTNITGNAATVTTNANLTGDVTSSGNATTIGASKVTSAMIVDATIVGGDLSATIVIPTGATATTQSSNDNSTKLATTKYVNSDRDGWFATSDTWVYASATTFTIAGVDRTTQLTKGTRISYNDGSVDYGVVGAVTFSTDTTVTLIANNQYSIANATLTAPRYSYAANPQGYPTWFGYTPTYTGYSANPSSAVYRFRVIGTECYLMIREATNGTSSLSTKTYSLPVTAATVTNAVWAGTMAYIDNAVASTTFGSLFVVSAATATNAYTNATSLGTWTATGGARVANGFVNYQF